MPSSSNLSSVAVDDPRAVQVDRHVLALGGDHEFVPVVVLDELVGLLFRVPLEDAAAALLVEQAPVTVGDVGLRAGDDAVGGSLAAELDARVAVPELDLGLEHEIAIGLLGGQELVLLEVALGPADDLAVLDGEERLVVGRDPAREVLAVEQALGLARLLPRAGRRRRGREGPARGIGPSGRLRCVSWCDSVSLANPNG